MVNISNFYHWSSKEQGFHFYTEINSYFACANQQKHMNISVNAKIFKKVPKYINRVGP